MSNVPTIDWLLDSDPAIRWQVMRDLTDASGEQATLERAGVATEGWGAGLLSLQRPDGGWGREDARRYIDSPEGSALHALCLLRHMGLDPESTEARTAVAAATRLTHYEGGQPFFSGEVEACINGRLLALGSYYGDVREALVERLLDDQLSDGGWNCDAPPSTRSSFHSTICVLEGLLEYERKRGFDAAISDARSRGHAYLLERRLFRSLSTGEIVDPRWLLPSFPTGYHYDILRGLDYLRVSDIEPDDRMADALDVIEQRRNDDGSWPLGPVHRDGLAFDMDEREGRASRWITLSAMRVLRWAGRDG